MTDRLPRPPTRLSPEARAWWRRIVGGWQLDDAALLILSVALESFDRMRGAQGEIQKHGLMTKGRTNPLILVERDARLAMLKAIRQLGLDLEPLHDRPGRPPGGGRR